MASGNTYRNMQYAWRVPHTISAVVKDVVQAIIEEYTDGLLFCLTTEQGWNYMADQWYHRWNFPHSVGAIDGKHVACKSPPYSGSEFYKYKGWWMLIASSPILTSQATVHPQTHRSTMEVISIMG